MCRLQQELELQQHSLQLLSERMAGSEGHQLAQALAETEAALQEAQAEAAAAADKKKEMVALAKVGKKGSRVVCACSRWRRLCGFAGQATRPIGGSCTGLQGFKVLTKCMHM